MTTVDFRFWLGVLLAVAIAYALFFGGDDPKQPAACRRAVTARTAEARHFNAELCIELSKP